MHSLLVNAILFDNDGTLIDSTPGVYYAWRIFGNEYGFDAVKAAENSHGRRLLDSLAELCHLEGQDLTSAVARFEQLVLDGGPKILPGVQRVLQAINEGSSHERPGWTVVTSATRAYASSALAKAGVPLPSSMVTSDDVSRGKPFPDPFLAGAERCRVDPKYSLVVEDAPSGLSSGRAAGAKTLAVCTSHSREALAKSNPDYIVSDLTRISVRWVGEQLEVTINDEDTAITNHQ